MSQDENIPRPKPSLEVATTRDGIDITRGYTGPLLPPTDKLLRLRGHGSLEIYESVHSDPKVMSTFRDRRNAVVQCEWCVDPASDRRVDKKAADHLSAQLQRVGFDRVTDMMMFGVFYGVAVAEIIYGIEGGLVVWDAIKVRNRQRFRFSSGERAELRMLTQENMFEGVQLPPAKFWHYATGADNDDDPYGIGLAHWCYWPVLFKRNGIKFWLTFLEKFAAPTTIGRFENSATSAADQARLLAAVQAVRTDSGIIYPKGMEIELLEASRSGSIDYKALHDVMDETIAQTVVGQTASTKGTPGKLGNENLQQDVRMDLITADADLICESLNQGPVRWLTRWNFPDADPPRVYRVTDPPDDLNLLAERDNKIRQMGFKPTLQYVTTTYGGEWEESEPPPQFGVPTGQPPARFAAGGAIHESPLPIDAQSDALATEAAPAWKATLAHVQQLVDNATSLSGLRDALLAAYADLPTEKLGEVMALAFTAANLAGRYDVHRATVGAIHESPLQG
jgi:phage gp29-like protein